MKVLLVNGSPHKEGCTNRALIEIKNTLLKEGIEADIFWIGNKPISGCIACMSCLDANKTFGKCAIDDVVNEFNKISGNYDGYIFGCPVHYGSAPGMFTSFLDRVFYSNRYKEKYILKPAACIVLARRGGTTATFDQINKYFTINQMPIVSSKYWNNVHGNNPLEVEKDEEGLQCMRTLANNMAYILKAFEIAENNGLEKPKLEQPLRTNFIK